MGTWASRDGRKDGTVPHQATSAARPLSCDTQFRLEVPNTPWRKLSNAKSRSGLSLHVLLEAGIARA